MYENKIRKEKEKSKEREKEREVLELALSIDPFGKKDREKKNQQAVQLEVAGQLIEKEDQKVF